MFLGKECSKIEGKEMPYAIEIDGLTKNYGPVRAVDSVSLQVGQGEIYGFLGLNGAGKTTTIRTLLGMIRPDEGTVRVLGEPVGPGGRGPWGRVGHMVEAPAAYPELTVYENLEIARRLQGVHDKERTGEVIEQLGLVPYRGRKAGKLSTGNRQRLGLARAMLHRPELLILDEPSSGLDPAGVVEIRELLETLTDQMGVTVFMSSHILTEVDRLASRVGIIHHGHLIEELDSGALETIRERRLAVRTRDLDAARQVLEGAGLAVKANERTLYLQDGRAVDAPDKVASLLVNGGAAPTYLAVEQENLEDYFLRITGGER
jgi:ABC-2 type transport system ATP-binding protein